MYKWREKREKSDVSGDDDCGGGGGGGGEGGSDVQARFTRFHFSSSLSLFSNSKGGDK